MSAIIHVCYREISTQQKSVIYQQSINIQKNQISYLHTEFNTVYLQINKKGCVKQSIISTSVMR